MDCFAGFRGEWEVHKHHMEPPLLCQHHTGKPSRRNLGQTWNTGSKIELNCFEYVKLNFELVTSLAAIGWVGLLTNIQLKTELVRLLRHVCAESIKSSEWGGLESSG